MESPIRVLVYDATHAGAESIARHLAASDDEIAAQAATATRAVTTRPVDCLVCAHGSESHDAIELIEALRSQSGCSAIPAIIFPESTSTTLLQRALSANVADCVVQTNDDSCYEALAERVRAATATSRSVDSSSGLNEPSRSPMDAIDLRRLAESNLVGTVLIQDLGFEYVNDHVAELFGYDRTTLLEELSVTDLVYEPDKPHLVEYLQRREWNLAEESLHTFRGVREDGTILQVELRSDRINARGSPQLLGLLSDVTPRKRREKELKRYRSIVNTAGDIVYALDSEGKFTFVNDRGLGLTGYDRGEIIGCHVSKLLDEQAVEKGETHIRELLKTEGQTQSNKTYEIALRTADGETVPCEANITILTHNGEFSGTVGVVRDISKQQALEAARRAERDQFAALFENITDPAVQYEMRDGTPHVIAVNPSFEAVFGYSQAEIEGESLDDAILPDGADDAQTLNEHVDAGNQIEVEVTRMATDGPRVFRLSTAQIVSTATPKRGYAIYSDVTDQKRRQDELERQNQQLEEFASVVSHDLRQPLGIAMGKLSILSETSDSPHIDDIEDALDRMESLIENVLTLARQGRIVDTPTPTSVESVVTGAWEMVEGDRASLTIDAPLGSIDADQQRLQELFENLFRNAIEHAGATVTVTVGALEGGGFYVADDGPGIPPDERDRVFDRGFTTAADGTGLGLVIVKTIVDAHGWEITVTESATGGVRFEITDPSPFR